ncbi:MAG: hypothetical protein JSS14_15295 [Proteobacteria bacterium]|nr:hypothetical protein [Pseudomonadota bacterium]
MTLSTLELSDAECAELLGQLAGPGTSQTQKWYSVVRKAFALGVERATPTDGLAEALVEPLIDIAETLAQAELALPPADGGERYAMYRAWAKEFESDFARRLDSGEAPAVTYYADIANFAMEKAKASGFVLSTRFPRTHAAPQHDVFRDYAIKGSREGQLEVDSHAPVNLSQDDPDLPPQGAYVMAFQYISNDEVIGFMLATLQDAGLEAGALDDAVHTSAELLAPAQAREEDLELISMDASDVNNAGPRTQIEYLVARLGPNGAYDEVLEAIAVHEKERPAAGPRS